MREAFLIELLDQGWLSPSDADGDPELLTIM
jgi:hypothetical protein